MQSEGGRGSDSCCAPCFITCFPDSPFLFQLQIHFVAQGEAKPHQVHRGELSLSLPPADALNTPLVSLCGQRNYQRKSLGSTSFTYRR